MEKLKNLRHLFVTQKKEWGEILSGFETKNKYAVVDESGSQLFFAVEEGGSFIGRIFLKANRPFTIKLLDQEQNANMIIRRPFRFFFHECTIFDASDKPVGSIKREFALLRKKYVILGPNNEELYSLLGPVFRPWTFKVLKMDNEVGTIRKKWSGFLKEGFTDADNFGIEFPVDADEKQRALLLGAVFLIDFVHFENRN